MTDYKHTEEYRDRFSFNQGERYWIQQAFNHFVAAAEAEVAGPDNGGVIAPGYFKQLFKDMDSKLDCWTD